MYTEIGEVPESLIEDLRGLLIHAEWQSDFNQGDYATWYPKGRLEDAFFLNIPPKGHVHRHVDNQKDYETVHLPVETNDQAVCYVEGLPYRLTVGKLYRVDRTRVHWSTNEGETRRVHLLIPCYENRITVHPPGAAGAFTLDHRF